MVNYLHAITLFLKGTLNHNPNIPIVQIYSYFVSRVFDDLRSGFFRLVLVPADHVDRTTLKERRVNRLHSGPQKDTKNNTLKYLNSTALDKCINADR